VLKPSEASKRVMDLGWTMMWFIVLGLALHVADSDAILFLLGLAFIVAASALRGTSAGLYFGVFLGGFIGILVLIFVVQAILHPDAWCPPPMHIEAANNQWGKVCTQ
jgi:hypothetical protein